MYRSLMIAFSEWVCCICWSSCQQFCESDEWYRIRCFMCSTPYIFPMGDLWLSSVLQLPLPIYGAFCRVLSSQQQACSCSDVIWNCFCVSIL